jgi:Tfp pilus assembly PilM family ATPase
MMLIGVYSSAISVSEDSKLRQSIRNFALESRLLDSIETEQMEQEIQRRVLTVTRENQERMAEESGIQTSLTEEDIKEYLEQVLNEIKKDHHPQ